MPPFTKKDHINGQCREDPAKCCYCTGEDRIGAPKSSKKSQSKSIKKGSHKGRATRSTNHYDSDSSSEHAASSLLSPDTSQREAPQINSSSVQSCNTPGRAHCCQNHPAEANDPQKDPDVKEIAKGDLYQSLTGAAYDGSTRSQSQPGAGNQSGQ